ncbi:RNA-binding protein 41 [Ctenodactylus gundi]
MTYSQPDSLINRWNFGLEDEEELFLCQASHVNVWDSPLIENDEEVTDFYEKVEKVKLVQTRLEQELDLILLQQKELEDLLAPLMESVKEHSGSVYLQHIDEKHEKICLLLQFPESHALSQSPYDLPRRVLGLAVCGLFTQVREVGACGSMKRDLSHSWEANSCERADKGRREDGLHLPVGRSSRRALTRTIWIGMSRWPTSVLWIPSYSERLRVNSCVKSDEHVLEELETEGERQLKSLLQHQLDTSVSIEECVSKKESFAPGTMYKPFGKEAAGTMTLSQFQTLHEKDQETASLRELGLNETEILIWKSHVSGEKKTKLRATPEAIQNRLQDIEERISERQRILCLPQRFSKSKQLTRREMEIEKSLFQGADRHSFLKALYYQAYHKKTSADKYMTSMKRNIKLGTKDEPKKKNKGDPMNNLESFYQEMIMKKRLEEFQLMRGEPFASHSLVSATPVSDGGTAENPSLLRDKGKQAAQGKSPSFHVAKVIDFSPEQCLTGPEKLTQPIEFVPEDEIQRNRLSEEEIRKIPMFSSYNRGEPNKVLYLKNLSPRVTERDLVSLFARFQKKKEPLIQFQMMTGRMRGQAFITFPNKESAWQALNLVNGYKLHGKILVIEFGRNKKQHPDVQAASSVSPTTDSSAEFSTG